MKYLLVTGMEIRLFGTLLHPALRGKDGRSGCLPCGLQASITRSELAKFPSLGVRRKIFFLLCLVFVFIPNNLKAEEREVSLIGQFLPEAGYYYAQENIEGLVGNGRMIVSTKAGSFWFRFQNLVNTGKIGLVKDKNIQWIDELKTNSFFVPGAVIYSFSDEGLLLEVGHTAFRDKDFYVTLVKVKNNQAEEKQLELVWELEAGDFVVEESKITVGENVLAFNCPFSVQEQKGKIIVFTKIKLSPGEEQNIMLNLGKEDDVQTTIVKNADELFKEIYGYYVNTGFILESPDLDLNRAVNFMKFHLQLGYDWPNKMVCDIFRWRDIWSRDFGSGFGPGGLGTGMWEAVRTTLEYELNRYKTHSPQGYKVSPDTSQGGSAEGLGLVLDLVWKYYLYTRDKDFLGEVYTVLSPWVLAWVKRDYDEDGLIVDVTEWMDHSRFMRLPEGMQTLYSNVLYAVMLESFGKICGVLEKKKEEKQFLGLARRTREAINTHFWDEEKGWYDNYLLWGVTDQRLAQADNALAVLYGIADQERTERVLAGLKTNNWRQYGSVTIFPRMSYPGRGSDHDYRCWPWWEAKEVKVRFINDDVEGARQVLKWCTDTLQYKGYPGLIEEYIADPDSGEIHDFAGHSFISAAGSVLDSLVSGMLGFEISETGELRINPRVPVDWKQWRVRIPLYDGVLEYSRDGDQVEVKSSNGKRVQIGSSLVKKMAKSKEIPVLHLSVPQLKVKKSPYHLKKIGVLAEEGFQGIDQSKVDEIMEMTAGLQYYIKRLSVEDLMKLEARELAGLIVFGNSLPFKDKNGAEVRPVIERYLNQGGRIFLLGPTCRDKGSTGEQGGLLDWQVWGNLLKVVKIEGVWKFKEGDGSTSAGYNEEEGYQKRYFAEELDETGWLEVSLPQEWEKTLGKEYDGYGWYRKKIIIPEEAQGNPFFIKLGKIDDDDWTYLNGELIGQVKGCPENREYQVRPEDKVYSTIKWGQENVLAVQCFDGVGRGGIYEGEQEMVIMSNQEQGWQYYDEKRDFYSPTPKRYGTVYWGEGNLFNDWSLKFGLFGYTNPGQGVKFSGLLGDLPAWENIEVNNVYTDYATVLPWRFIPMAWTQAKTKFTEHEKEEHFPCLAYLENIETGGKVVLLAPEILQVEKFRAILKILLKEL